MCWPRPSAPGAPACLSTSWPGVSPSCSVPALHREIDVLVQDGELVREEDWIYRRETAALERELAERVADLVGSPAPDPRHRLGRRARRPARSDAKVASDATAPSHADDAQDPDADPGPALTEEQKTAVRGVLKHGSRSSPGGPGRARRPRCGRSSPRPKSRDCAYCWSPRPDGRPRGCARHRGCRQARCTRRWDGFRVRDPLTTRRTRCAVTCSWSTRPRWPTSNCSSRCCARSLPRPQWCWSATPTDGSVGAGKPFAELVADGHVPTTRLSQHLTAGGREHDRPGCSRHPARPTPGSHGGARHAWGPVLDRACGIHCAPGRRSSRSWAERLPARFRCRARA